ncbi:polyketide synthase dehydratase domain-containing protein, partial [Flavivirga jejuensis]|uniref:polyketide synthase dehydratase domain-containing protein n=1 Tax=Flavivirga jejuensis TaxID=870487 RepID=UPI0031E507E1
MLKDNCQQRILSSEECYGIFKKMKLEYGLAHQSIKTLYIGSKQALAKLELPESLADSLKDYVLHPSIMDAAFQASIGTVIGTLTQDSPIKSSLPYALEELTVIDPCTTNMWAWVRLSPTSTTNDKIQKIDIDLCDATGKICVKIKSFSSRVLEE